MGLRYTMSFSDLAGREVGVSIYNDGWTGGVTVLTGGASPLTLDEDATEGIDTPCRAWTGVLTVRTEEGVDYSGLYAADVTSARVEVWRGGGLTWQGYLVPEVMRQSWVAGEELSVNVQSPLGALAGLTLDASAGFGFSTLGGLLGEALALTGDWDTVTFPDDLSVGEGGTDTWLDVEASRMAFFTREYDEGEWDETEQARIVYEGATGREVVEAVARLTGWTARERGRELWLTAESVAGYKRVGVAELGLPGRQVEDVAAPVMELDALTPAGTDHTVSTLRGYRRVRVRFSADVVDNLLNGLDPHNWAATGEVEFEEDVEAWQIRTVAGQQEIVNVGWYVSTTGWDLFSTLERVAVNYRFARYDLTSVDGGSHVNLSRIYTRDGVTYIDPLQTTTQLAKWAWIENSEQHSFFGAEIVWLRYKYGLISTETSGGRYNIYVQGVPSRQFGVLIWDAYNRNTPLPSASAVYPALVTKSVTPLYMPQGAIRLSANLSGYISCNAASFPVPFSLTKMGPWSPTKFGAVNSLRLMLKFGEYYWDGSKWVTAPTNFEIVLSGEDTDDHAEISPTNRIDDADIYIGGDSGYIIPLRDEWGNDLPIIGDIELRVYMPNTTASAQGEVFFNPLLLYNLTAEPLRKTDSYDAYREDGSEDNERTYLAQTGYKGTEDVYDVETRLGTWANDGCAMNVLIKDGAPVEAFTSKRQGGKTGRPERLLLSTLGRLYGRARRQLEVEVDAAGLPPSVTLTDGGRRYALTGLHWDVREGTARYVMEDFVAIDN